MGSRHDVTWTLAEAVDVGSFDVWAWSPSTSWYQLNGLARSSPCPARPTTACPGPSPSRPPATTRSASGTATPRATASPCDDSDAPFTVAAPVVRRERPQRRRDAGQSGSRTTSPGRSPRRRRRLLRRLGLEPDLDELVPAQRPAPSWPCPARPTTACPGPSPSRRPATTGSASGTATARRLPHQRRLRHVFTIAPLTSAVSTPNGGETLGQNGTSDVTWAPRHAVRRRLLRGLRLEPDLAAATSSTTAPIAAVPAETDYTPPLDRDRAAVRRLPAPRLVPQRRAPAPHHRRLRRVFTIAALSLTVSAPNGGETLGLNGRRATSPGRSPGRRRRLLRRLRLEPDPRAATKLNAAPSPPWPGETELQPPLDRDRAASGDYTGRVWYRDAQRRRTSPRTTPTRPSRSPRRTLAVSAPNGGETLVVGQHETSPGRSPTPSASAPSTSTPGARPASSTSSTPPHRRRGRRDRATASPGP